MAISSAGEKRLPRAASGGRSSLVLSSSAGRGPWFGECCPVPPVATFPVGYPSNLPGGCKVVPSRPPQIDAAAAWKSLLNPFSFIIGRRSSSRRLHHPSPSSRRLSSSPPPAHHLDTTSLVSTADSSSRGALVSFPFTSCRILQIPSIRLPSIRVCPGLPVRVRPAPSGFHHILLSFPFGIMPDSSSSRLD